MPPKGKASRADGPKAAPVAAAAGPSTDQAAAAKQAADLYKQFKKKNDHKLLPKIEAAAEAAQAASATVCLVKFYLLLATDLVLKKGKSHLWLDNGRATDPVEREERMRQEDELQAELVPLLNKALAAAVAVLSKERAYNCLHFAVQLAGLLRGRGSPAELQERLAVVQHLTKRVDTLVKLLSNKKTGPLVTWLPLDKEATPPPLWPLELVVTGVSFKSPQHVMGNLMQFSSILEKCEAADNIALRHVQRPRLAELGIEPLIEDAAWEARCRVQERLAVWPILPPDDRERLARKYHHRPMLGGADMAAAREPTRTKVTREQAAKVQRQEERKQSIAKTSDRATEELQRKAKAEAEAAAAAQAKRAKQAAEWSEAVQEYLSPRVAAAADKGQEAQEAALAAELRMPVAALRSHLQRQAQAKERSEAEVALTRTALDRVIANKPLFFACPPTLAAAVAAPECGGLGQAALRGTPGMVAGEDSYKRCSELLLKALQGNARGITSLYVRKSGQHPTAILAALIPLVDKIHEVDMELKEVQVNADEPEPGSLMVPAEGDPPAEADMKLLALAAREGLQSAAALVYLEASEHYKQRNLLEGGMYSFADLDAEDEQVLMQGVQLEAQQAAGTAAGAAAADAAADAAAGAADAAGGAAAPADSSAAAAGGVQAAPQVALDGGLSDEAATLHPPLATFLSNTFGFTAGQSMGLTDVQQSATPHSEETLLANKYGSTYDWAALLQSCLVGMMLLDLLEAHERGERPAGWGWHHYTAVLHGMDALGPDNVATYLGLGQANRPAALRQAAVAQAFTRWLVGMHRRIDAHCRVQAAQDELLLAQEQQQGSEAATSSAAAGEAPAAAAATEPEAAAAAAAGEQAAEEDLEYTQEVQYIPTVSDLHIRGLAAVCLAATDVPADVAAAAAACSDGSSGEAAAAAGRVAAWVRSERLRLVHRLLLVLRHLHKGGVLTLSMTNAVLEFIIAEAPDAAMAAVKGEPAQQQQQQGEQQGEEAEADEGAGAPAALLSMQQALSLLPQLPLGSLHQLQAFLCLQLCWRGPSMPHVERLCLDGEAELLSHCLELRSSKAGGGKGGAAGGQQELALTPIGVRWALPPLAPAATASQQEHPSGKHASPADLVARLAEAVKLAGQPPTPAAPDAAGGQPAPTQQQQQQQGQQGRDAQQGATNSSSSTAAPAGEGGAAAASTCSEAAADASGSAAGSKKQLPVYLRLLEAQQDWEPPSTLEAQVTLMCSLSPAPKILQGVAAAATAAADESLALASINAGIARAAALCATAFTAVLGVAQEAVQLAPQQPLEAVRQWLLKFNPTMPLPVSEGLAAEIDRGISKAQLAILNLERYVALLNLCSLAANAGQTDSDMARAQESLAQEQRRVAEAQAAGDEAARQQAESAVAYWQNHVSVQGQNIAELRGRISKVHKQLDLQFTGSTGIKQGSKRATEQIKLLRQALDVLCEASKPSSEASKEERKQQLSVVKEAALQAIDELDATQLSREGAIEELSVYMRLLIEQLVLRNKAAMGGLLGLCQYYAHQQLARDLLLHLLPAHWHDELARQRSSADEAALLAEEEAEQQQRAREEAKERERKEKLRQAEIEKREAERRAKEEAERQAAAEREQQRKLRAAAVASRAGRLGDYRAELGDLEGAEEDEWEELEAEQREREAEARRQEGYNRLLEEAGQVSDDEEWTQVDAPTAHAGRRQQQQGQQAQQQGRRQAAPTSPRRQQQRSGGDASKVLAVSRLAIASTAAIPVPKRASPAPSGASWAEQVAAPSTGVPPAAPSSSASSATVVAAEPAGPGAAAGGDAAVPAGGWSFDAWQQQEQQEAAAPPQQQDAELDSLLADMGIPPTEQPPAPPAAAAHEDEEDEDLRRAIEASMDRSQDVVPSQARLAGGWASGAASGGDASGGAAAGRSGAATEELPDGVKVSGMRNEAGEYNCFLNVIVQCMWQCVEFRRRVAQWGPEARGAHPIMGAMFSLFEDFRAQQEADGVDGTSPSTARTAGAAGAAGGSSAMPSPARPAPPAAAGMAPATPPKAWQPGHKPAWLLKAAAAANGSSNGAAQLPPVDPTALREVLATLPGRKFATGEMHDAAEVLLSIYEAVMDGERKARGEGSAEALTAVEEIFGVKVQEEVHCSACGKTSHHNGYTQYLCITQGLTLRMLREVAPTMAQRLREAADQEMKSCDVDLAGCGRRNGVNHFLQRAPRVFTLNLCWTTMEEDPADIAATMAAVDETVDLGEIYQGVDRGVHRYTLRSMVCYYGAHYQALVWVPGAANKAKGESGAWLMFDDTRVSRVGSWADVQRKCEAGRIQPSLLFYEAVA